MSVKVTNSKYSLELFDQTSDFYDIDLFNAGKQELIDFWRGDTINIPDVKLTIEHLESHSKMTFFIEELFMMQLRYNDIYIVKVEDPWKELINALENSKYFEWSCYGSDPESYENRMVIGDSCINFTTGQMTYENSDPSFMSLFTELMKKVQCIFVHLLEIHQEEVHQEEVQQKVDDCVDE